MLPVDIRSAYQLKLRQNSDTGRTWSTGPEEKFWYREKRTRTGERFSYIASSYVTEWSRSRYLTRIRATDRSTTFLTEKKSVVKSFGRTRHKREYNTKWFLMYWDGNYIQFYPLKTKRRPLYLKTQSVPRSKHLSTRL